MLLNIITRDPIGTGLSIVNMHVKIVRKICSQALYPREFTLAMLLPKT